MLNLTPDELLSTTRSVRIRLDYERPVARELIDECLTLAFQAPNGSNMNSWEWVVVDDPEPDGLFDPARRGRRRARQQRERGLVDRYVGGAGGLRSCQQENRNGQRRYIPYRTLWPVFDLKLVH